MSVFLKERVVNLLSDNLCYPLPALPVPPPLLDAVQMRQANHAHTPPAYLLQLLEHELQTQVPAELKDKHTARKAVCRPSFANQRLELRMGMLGKRLRVYLVTLISHGSSEFWVDSAQVFCHGFGSFSAFHSFNLHKQ